MTDPYAKPYNYDALVIKEKKHICPIHGEIGYNVINSTIPEFKMKLCLRCYLEKLVEIGVQKVEERE